MVALAFCGLKQESCSRGERSIGPVRSARARHSRRPTVRPAPADDRADVHPPFARRPRQGDAALFAAWHAWPAITVSNPCGGTRGGGRAFRAAAKSPTTMVEPSPPPNASSIRIWRTCSPCLTGRAPWLSRSAKGTIRDGRAVTVRGGQGVDIAPQRARLTSGSMQERRPSFFCEP